MKKLYFFALCVFEATTALGGVGSAYLSNEQVQNRDEVVGYGREYALGTARDSANHAAQVAGGTGVALTSAGVGFLLAGNLPLGATLISMGAVEFAQMGATGGVSQQNGDQRAQLVNGSALSDKGLEDKNGNDFRSQLDPRLDDYLKNQGINADQFKDLLLSGDFSDPNAVLSSLGANPADYSTKVMEKALGQAQQEFVKLSKDIIAALPSAGSGPSSLGLLGGGSTPKPEGITKVNPESREKSDEEGRGNKKAKGSKTEGASDPFFSQGIQNYFGLPAHAFSQNDQALLFEAFLREQGIVPKLTGMNIFQMAQQSYRGFAKSRAFLKNPKTRVAKAR